MSEMAWIILAFGGIAWWNIDRAIYRSEGRIIRRIDALEACLARIELNTAPAHKDLGTLLDNALKGK